MSATTLPDLRPDPEAIRCRGRLLMTVAALAGFGLVAVGSAGAARVGGWDMAFAWNQAQWLCAAAVAGLAVAMTPHRWWERLWWLTVPAAWIPLILVLTPLGTRVNGANRWFRYAGFQAQPSEAAKFLLVVAVAAFLARARTGKPRFFAHVLPAAIVTGVVTGLIAVEPDFGTAALVGAAAVAMLVAGGTRLSHLVLLAGPGIAAAAFVALTRFDHVAKRLAEWQAGDGFHTNASITALGSGGLWGMGLGHGAAKLHYLPESQTDFIFALMGQELGLAGTLAVTTLFAFFVWQGLAVAQRAPDRLGMLLAFGATVIVGGQAAFNMGVVTGLLPPKGIPLPFVSFGGSGLCVNFALVGLIVAVSRARARKEDYEWKQEEVPSPDPWRAPGGRTGA